jgi:hypothetical protein
METIIGDCLSSRLSCGHAQNQIKYGLQQSPFAGLCSEICYSYHFIVLLDRVSGSRLYQVPRAVEQRIVSDLMAYIPYWSSSCMIQGPDEWLGDTDVVMESLRRATSEPMLAANLVTGARVAVNCFKHHALHTWTMDHRSEVIFSFFYWLLHMFTSYLCSLTPIQSCKKRWMTRWRIEIKESASRPLLLFLFAWHQSLVFTPVFTDFFLQILDLLAECCKSTNKSARLAYATLVLKYALSGLKKNKYLQIYDFLYKFWCLFFSIMGWQTYCQTSLWLYG